MWRKIHSNRDPRDTLYSELKKEVGPHFTKAGSFSKHILTIYPKCFFWGMVVTMMVSIVLAFTISRHPRPVKQKSVGFKAAPVQEGFEQILLAAGKIKKTIRLKRLVDSITAKKQLTTMDTIALDSALSQLQRLKTLK